MVPGNVDSWTYFLYCSKRSRHVVLLLFLDLKRSHLSQAPSTRPSLQHYYSGYVFLNVHNLRPHLQPNPLTNRRHPSPRSRKHGLQLGCQFYHYCYHHCIEPLLDVSRQEICCGLVSGAACEKRLAFERINIFSLH